MEFSWKAVGFGVPPVAQSEMGLAQVRRGDPALVWPAPSRLGLPPGTGNPKPSFRDNNNRVVLPVEPMKTGTLICDASNTLRPGDFHTLPWVAMAICF